jgi:hypothetical protein
MSRNSILALGSFLWTIAIAVGIVHAMYGDWGVPAVMAASGFFYVGLRRTLVTRPETVPVVSKT